MYRYNQRPNTTFTNQAEKMIESIRDSEYAVLVGRNNCGKSYLLKTLTQKWGASASYLGPARYQNFTLLGSYTPSANRRDQRWSEFSSSWNRQDLNIDNSPINLQQAIAELTDAQRESLIEIIDLLLKTKMEIKETVPGNSMSQKYISCDGHNISYTSSGFRLIATLLTSLLSTDHDTFLVDEPELGISPEAQGVLSEFLFDRSLRPKYFSHIRTLIFATHSTVFLDRKNIENNYKIEKKGSQIDIGKVNTVGELHKVHFFLLGNRFETLYLPSAIVLVEGKTDHQFIERTIALRFPTSKISVISANSDSRIKEILSITGGIFSDIQRSPYRDRIYIVLDSVHSASLPEQLEKLGILGENIIKWPQNGIEHFYPPELLDQLLPGAGPLSIIEDMVSRGGVEFRKNEICEKVCVSLAPSTKHHPDIERLLLQPLSTKLL
jgi:energy-coupling factor transporter ATP-binding protein EcfA2